MFGKVSVHTDRCGTGSVGVAALPCPQGHTYSSVGIVVVTAFAFHHSTAVVFIKTIVTLILSLLATRLAVMSMYHYTLPLLFASLSCNYRYIKPLCFVARILVVSTLSECLLFLQIMRPECL
jgi:hypothetical protein